MKLTDEMIVISPSEEIFWREIKTIRHNNEKLTFELKAGRIVEVPHLHPSTVDAVFKAYEHYLRVNPERKK